MMNYGKKSCSCFDRYLLGILIALELFMSFSFLGYIHIEPISITLSYVPVVIAASIFGPLEAMILGAVFGLGSMFKATATYIMPFDAVFSPFVSGAPLNSVALAIGARALFGLGIGFLFRAARKLPRPGFCMAIVAALSPKIHSLVLYSFLGQLFPQLGYSYLATFKWSAGDTLMAGLCVILVELSVAAYNNPGVCQVRSYIDNANNNPYTSRRVNWLFAGLEIVIFLFAVFSAVYISRRIEFMLDRHGIIISDDLDWDMLVLQMQFLFALLALNFISIILLVAMYKYMAFREYRGEIDELTGIMGRRMFLYYCEKAQGQNVNKKGWFLFVDADYFKAINDTLGHAAGDMVLKEIAANLQKNLAGQGQAGRLGGDEFAAIIEAPMSKSELEAKLRGFLDEIAGVLPDRKVSCSIGAYQFVFPQPIRSLLAETDAMLYKAKEMGRACYAVKGCSE